MDFRFKVKLNLCTWHLLNFCTFSLVLQLLHWLEINLPKYWCKTNIALWVNEFWLQFLTISLLGTQWKPFIREIPYKIWIGVLDLIKFIRRNNLIPTTYNDSVDSFKISICLWALTQSRGLSRDAMPNIIRFIIAIDLTLIFWNLLKASFTLVTGHSDCCRGLSCCK